MTREKLVRLLKYNEETGQFIWLVSFSRVRAGDVAGTRRPDRYRQIRIDGKIYLEHRLAWFYMTGEWPPDQIDHKDLDRSNNKWTNLRLATNAQNQINAGLQTNNTSGYRGVCSDGNQYKAQIKYQGRVLHLGSFNNKQDASLAYISKAKELFGEFVAEGEVL